MTQTEAREAIYRTFRDEWDEDLAAPSVEDVAFTPPPKKPWVRLAVRHQASAQETLGPPARRWLRAGSIFVQVFAPRDKGLLESDQIGQAVRAMFEARELLGPAGPGSVVRCYETTIRETGTDGPWFLTVADTRFDYDEFR